MRAGRWPSVLDELGESDQFDIERLPTVAAVESAIDNDEISAAFVLPDGFDQGVSAGGATLEVIGNVDAPTGTGIAYGDRRSLRHIGRAGDADRGGLGGRRCRPGDCSRDRCGGLGAADAGSRRRHRRRDPADGRDHLRDGGDGGVLLVLHRPVRCHLPARRTPARHVEPSHGGPADSRDSDRRQSSR